MRRLRAEEMNLLRNVALGQEKADLVLEGGSIVNVYTGELVGNQYVAIKGKWIAYVGPKLERFIGSDTECLDVTGKIVIPGLIDGHTHLFYYCTPDEFLRYGMKGGTTAIVTELMDVAFSFGYRGLLELLDGLKNQPIKIFATVPPAITLSEGFKKKAPKLEELKVLLRKEDILGVGEGYWQDVLRGDQNFSALAEEAMRLGKSVEGHAAGCRGERLRAYLDFGISSCHESVHPDEVVEKLRLGLCTMIRQGSVRKELDAMVTLKDRVLDFRRLALVTDSIDPRELLEKGYMEYVVQRAIDVGFDPILAIRMATINPAEHFHLDDALGGIAPGKYADIIVIPDLRTIDAQYVISNGRIIAERKELKVMPRKVELSVPGPKDIRVEPSDFAVSVKGKGPYKVRVIKQITRILTRESVVEMSPVNGQLRCLPMHDILKVSLITWERKVFTGFIVGLGLRAGAIATSYAWEGFGIIVAGTNERDMALAVNRVSETGGGAVICSEGKFLSEVAFPIGGILSDLPIEKLVEKLNEIQSNAEELGSRSDDVLLTLSTLTSPAIPFLRVSEDGLVDLKQARRVGLFLDE